MMSGDEIINPHRILTKGVILLRDRWNGFDVGMGSISAIGIDLALLALELGGARSE